MKSYTKEEKLSKIVIDTINKSLHIFCDCSFVSDGISESVSQKKYTFDRGNISGVIEMFPEDSHLIREIASKLWSQEDINKYIEQSS